MLTKKISFRFTIYGGVSYQEKQIKKPKRRKSKRRSKTIFSILQKCVLIYSIAKQEWFQGVLDFLPFL